MTSRSLSTLRATLTVCAAALAVRAQGTFTNFETPQTHPIEVATINGTEVVLVCNTPDNSLEVWTATASPALISRVAVGMGPGTVRWNAQLQRAFVCNFDGDSVSVIEFPAGGQAGVLERTTYVGDEPADITFHPNGGIGFATLSTLGKIQFVNPNGLGLFGDALRLDVDFAANNGLYGTANLPLAVKAPRQAAWLANDRLLVLNFMGGQSVPNVSLFADVDLWRIDQALNPASTPNYLGGLGTTNHAFAVTANGSRMFVVGTRAQNLVNIGGAANRNAVTGFAQSWLSVVDIPASGNLVQRPEAPAGGPAGPANAFPGINLNRDYAVGAMVQEVNSDDAIVQPTGIDLFESGGSVQRIALTGFHSDNVALLTPNTGVSGGYLINRVPLTPPAGYSIVGPRGVAFNAAGSLLFTNGRLDNTLRVVDTTTLNLTTVQLQQDPTPPVIRNGRQFLYSVRFSRGVNSGGPNASGFVSCATCHVDGRTDALPWDLSDPDATPAVPIPPPLTELTPPGDFPNPKGVMITQTLQGLVDFQTNESFQFVATNAPYHWRGDRFDEPTSEGFTKFNEAFVNLQGMRNVAGAGQPDRGISTNEMIDYRRFVLTIRHPPNPEQELDRRVTGVVPVNPNVANPNVIPLSATPGPNDFSGSAAGRALFHNYRLDLNQPKACVDCHVLPAGTSKTITEVNVQPVESAALRNLFAREGMVHTSTMPDPLTAYPTTPMPFPGTAFVSNRGLTHDGGASLAGGTQFSINNFTANPAVFFLNMPAIAATFPNPTVTELDLARAQTDALIQFVRELDAGVAPLAGFAYTANPATPSLNQQAFDGLEAQVAQANIGLGVRVRDSAGGVSGFWFEPTVGYRNAAAPLATALTRAQLLALLAPPGTRMMLQGTPLGTERRWADPAGLGQVTTGPSPTGIFLEEMAPNTFYEGITDFTMQVNPLPVGNTRWRLEHFHNALAGSFGVPMTRRHEPPRRFRVSGVGIRPGARMFLFLPDGQQPVTPFPVGMELPIYRTGFTGNNMNPVWESELELSSLQTYAFLCGGPLAPGVQGTFDTPVGAAGGPALLPATFNQYQVLILNEDSTLSALTTPAPLRIRDTR